MNTNMEWLWPESRLTGALRRSIVFGGYFWLIFLSSTLRGGSGLDFPGSLAILGLNVALLFCFDGVFYRIDRWEQKRDRAAFWGRVVAPAARSLFVGVVVGSGWVVAAHLAGLAPVSLLEQTLVSVVVAVLCLALHVWRERKPVTPT